MRLSSAAGREMGERGTGAPTNAPANASKGAPRKVPKLGVVQMLEAELELAAGGRGGARLGEQRKHAGGWATNTDGSC